MQWRSCHSQGSDYTALIARSTCPSLNTISISNSITVKRGSTWCSAARDGGEDVSFEFAPSPTPSPTSQPTSAPAFHDEDSSDCTTNVEEVLVSSIILY